MKKNLQVRVSDSNICACGSCAYAIATAHPTLFDRAPLGRLLPGNLEVASEQPSGKALPVLTLELVQIEKTAFQLIFTLPAGNLLISGENQGQGVASSCE